jgi:UDP:flavonoid glycosyltransferase YjiC (YdhE family)
VPIQFDEGFWAGRLVRAGVAPGVVPLRGLTAGTLASALVRAVREPAFRERAQDMGARIRAEDEAAPVVGAVNRAAG